MGSIQNQVVQDWKEALKAKSKKKDVLSLIITEMKNRAIKDNVGKPEARIVADDAALDVLTRMAKQRMESIESFKAANRMDLAEKEANELLVIKSYLPEPLSSDQVQTLIVDAIKELNATSKKDLGKIMGKILPSVKGRFDGKMLQTMVMAELGRIEEKS